jgi:hypothetical protein
VEGAAEEEGAAGREEAEKKTIKRTRTVMNRGTTARASSSMSATVATTSLLWPKTRTEQQNSGAEN